MIIRIFYRLVFCTKIQQEKYSIWNTFIKTYICTTAAEF